MAWGGDGGRAGRGRNQGVLLNRLCTLQGVQCTLYTVHYTLKSVHCTLHTVHCTLDTVHCGGDSNIFSTAFGKPKLIILHSPRISVNTTSTFLSLRHTLRHFRYRMTPLNHFSSRPFHSAPVRRQGGTFHFLCVLSYHPV